MLVSVVRMMTMLKGYPTEEQCSVVRFLWAEGLDAKDIHKEMFPVCCGMCLSHKVVHKCVADVSLMLKRLRQH
jgi:hypothetical protein